MQGLVASLSHRSLCVVVRAAFFHQTSHELSKTARPARPDSASACVCALVSFWNSLARGSMSLSPSGKPRSPRRCAVCRHPSATWASLGPRVKVASAHRERDLLDLSEICSAMNRRALRHCFASLSPASRSKSRILTT